MYTHTWHMEIIKSKQSQAHTHTKAKCRDNTGDTVSPTQKNVNKLYPRCYQRCMASIINWWEKWCSINIVFNTWSERLYVSLWCEYKHNIFLHFNVYVLFKQINCHKQILKPKHALHCSAHSEIQWSTIRKWQHHWRAILNIHSFSLLTTIRCHNLTFGFYLFQWIFNDLSTYFKKKSIILWAIPHFYPLLVSVIKRIILRNPVVTNTSCMVQLSVCFIRWFGISRITHGVHKYADFVNSLTTHSTLIIIQAEIQSIVVVFIIFQSIREFIVSSAD